MLVLLAIAVLGAGVFMALGPGKAGISGEPHHFTVEGSTVTVFGQSGQPLWSVGVDGTVAKADLAKLFPDKPPFLVVGVGVKDRKHW